MKIGLFGLGQVGSKLYSLLKNDHEVMVCVKDINKPRMTKVPNLTSNYLDIINDKSIDFIVEMISNQELEDVELSKNIIIKSLENGKDVFTCNKRVFGMHGYELCRVANDLDRTIYFDSLVAHGSPHEPWDGPYLTSKNVLDFNQGDLLKFRGGGGIETAKHIYDEISLVYNI